ncbi:hypothetical protein KDM41_16330, partial [bacterium]|nr:hypothetical protein [bacterium]
APKAPSGRSAAWRGRTISGFEMGFFFTISVLVAAAGMGAAVLLAVGVNPVSLWQPETFFAWQNYTRLTENPLNVLALIGLAVVVLTLLGSSAFARAAGRANARTRAAERMLDRVTALRLENEPAWQDPALKDDDAVATFAAETLGAWRLQHARQRHFTGLEGELHRLEKALADNSRTDLTGRFDNPAAGSLADQMIRYFDEREALSREVAERRAGDEAEATEIESVLHDARSAQHVTRQNVTSQAEALRKLAAALDLFAGDLDSAQAAAPVAAMAAFKNEFDKVCRMADDAGGAATPTDELVQLVDRSSKLAFQIAMEVSRLGARGERLGPMSQALEDLTTDFRQLTDKFNVDRGKPSLGASLERLAGKLADLEKQFETGEDSPAVAARAFGPAAEQLAANLGDLAAGFEPQADRLTHLGEKFSDFAGTPFDADDLSGDPDNPPAGVLSLEGRMPAISTGESIHQPADVDPFAVTPPKVAPRSEPEPDHGFTRGSGAGGDIFGGGLDRTAMPDLEIETSFSMRTDPFATGGDATAEPDLSGDGEKVYDLEAFGAESVVADEVPVAETPLAAAPEVVAAAPVAPVAPAAPVVPEEPSAEADAGEHVHDLSEFDATPLTLEAEPASRAAASVAHDTAEKVYDLAEFGAVRIDEAGGGAGDEEIYELAEFGAVPLG